MKILVFAPHSAIWIHALPEALVAESLARSGHEVVYVTCGGVFQDYCIPMCSSGMRYDARPAEKRRMCAVCGGNARVLRSEFGFAGYDLASVLTDADRTEAQALVGRVDRNNFQTIELGGLAVGRFALYQFLILHKKIGYEFSAAEWEEYLLHFKATALAIAALRHVFARERPDRVLLYNGLYSVNMACRELAAKRGAPAYFLHAGGGLGNRLQTLMLGREHTFRFYPALVRRWSEYREIPISRESMIPATEHFIELLRGRSGFAYSPAKSDEEFDVRKRFDIGSGKRIVVAAMGSYDEEFAAEAVGARQHARPPLFATQADWIRELLAFFARRQDLFLIIRVHPRELPNRREKVKSEHAVVLEQLLSQLPGNAAVNWPTDGISLYDLAEETDVFLNSWSSVGKEMSLLGRAVVTYADEIIFYPPDLNYTAPTVAGYFEQIEQALADGWSAERVRMTYRWLAIEYGRGLVDIAESYSEHESREVSLGARIVRKVRRMLDPQAIHRRDCRRRAPALRAAQSIDGLVRSARDTLLDVPEAVSVEKVERGVETRSLREEIARLLPHLYRRPGVARPGALRAHLTAFVEGL